MNITPMSAKLGAAARVTHATFEIEGQSDPFILSFHIENNVVHVHLPAELFTADTGTLVLRREQDEVRVIIYVAEEE